MDGVHGHQAFAQSVGCSRQTKVLDKKSMLIPRNGVQKLGVTLPKRIAVTELVTCLTHYGKGGVTPYPRLGSKVVVMPVIIMIYRPRERSVKGPSPSMTILAHGPPSVTNGHDGRRG